LPQNGEWNGVILASYVLLNKRIQEKIDPLEKMETGFKRTVAASGWKIPERMG